MVRSENPAAQMAAVVVINAVLLVTVFAGMVFAIAPAIA